jgi:phospholipid/cholesterol/gamma-HCH transport system permease protein
MAESSPRLDWVQNASGWIIKLRGDWVLANLPLSGLPKLPQLSGTILLDGSELARLDPSGAQALLTLLEPAEAAGQALVLEAFQPASREIFEMVRTHFAESTRQWTRARNEWGLLTRFGYGTVRIWKHVLDLIRFVGQLSVEWWGLMTAPKNFRFKEVVVQFEMVFVDAIPIIMAMIFLLGIVFAYLLGIQAQKYGANIFVVDGVSAAILREISPVIVAILVAGRSGAAITAQLGAMKVNEEIDAISVLGLSPIAVLVFPRILVLILSMPLLVCLGDVSGVLGGMVVADAQLGINVHLFIERLDKVLKIQSYLIGLVKAPVFGLFVGLIACRMGLSVSRDARSVGEHTTSTVVQSIVAVIVLNAIFAILFADVPI